MNEKRALFLDRDGVINQQLPGDYVARWDQFKWIDGTLEALQYLQNRFSPIVIVTNQQGISKGLMDAYTLHLLHYQMRKKLSQEGVNIDAIYFCPFPAHQNPTCRKPNTGMAQQAKADFPSIDFESAVMVGDSDSDMEFGKALGMYTVKIQPNITSFSPHADVQVESLIQWVNRLRTPATNPGSRPG